MADRRFAADRKRVYDFCLVRASQASADEAYRFRYAFELTEYACHKNVSVFIY